MEEQLQQIYDDSGRPGAEAFRFKARRQGVNITAKEAQDFVKKQSIGQVFTGRLVSDGKVEGGSRDNDKAQMDLIDFSKKIKRLKGTRYVLCLVSLFDREASCEPL